MATLESSSSPVATEDLEGEHVASCSNETLSPSKRIRDSKDIFTQNHLVSILDRHKVSDRAAMMIVCEIACNLGLNLDWNEKATSAKSQCNKHYE